MKTATKQTTIKRRIDRLRTEHTQCFNREAWAEMQCVGDKIKKQWHFWHQVQEALSR